MYGIDKLTGDMQSSPALCDGAMFSGHVEKWKSILSPPGELGFRVTLGQARQSYVQADVRLDV